ncbi:MAG: hypothetical protein HY763_16085 [Planctomycetes bacterium]|nr:hypothetical protein [Planctomycetota bacterium]
MTGVASRIASLLAIVLVVLGGPAAPARAAAAGDPGGAALGIPPTSWPAAGALTGVQSDAFRAVADAGRTKVDTGGSSVAAGGLTEACCRGTDCADLSPQQCSQGGGQPQGPGTNCANNPCQPAIEACCLQNGGCTETTSDRCIAAGGTRLGPGSNCKGDHNNNGRDDACEADPPCADCGPGPHWVDQCAPGSDNMPTGALVGIDFDLDCIADVSLVLSGPATVARTRPLDDSMHFPGLRSIDGHLDVIDTEMLSMMLLGGGVQLTAGQGLGAGGVLGMSPGAIAETMGDPSLADSFFDIFVEVAIPGAPPLYNQQPLRVRSEVDCLPPNATYLHPTGCIPLFTAPQGGVHVANLVSARHGTYPTCGSEVTGDCLTPHDSPFCNDGACCSRVCELASSCCQNQWTQNCTGLAREVCNLEACCLSNGGCQRMTPRECLAQGGTRLGPDARCEGDGNTNGRDDACEPDASCEDCGPGPHWVDQCLPGADAMPTGALVGIDSDLDCVADTSVVLSGPAWVGRSFPLDDSMQFPGLSTTDGHLDVIDTEMLSMSLTGGGITLIAGAGLGAGGMLNSSLGAIVEQGGDPTSADSFFDVFFEIEVGGGTRLYNQVGLKVLSKVDCLPPTATYIHPTGCIPLYTSPVPGQGVHVANLVSARHGTYPTCGSEVTGDCFKPHDTPYCNDGACCDRVCGLDPSCCQSDWSANCAGLAERACRPQACCRQDGQCVEIPELECAQGGGIPQGPGTSCGVSVCAPPIEACCLPNGGCTETTPDRCHAGGGTRLGPGSNCKGDNNNNGRDDACEPNHPCDECGPGPHWVDQCPGGSDNMPSGALVGIDADFDCVADTSVVLSGPATVARTSARDVSGRFPGLGMTDGHIDVIDTEMLAMSLTGGGISLLAGGGRGNGGVLRPSHGAILEQPGDPSLADSFFDIFFEVEAGGQFMYNQTPLKVESKVDCLPPVTTYIHPTGCTPLYSDPVGGVHVANLVSARHGTFPTCGSEVTGDCFTPHDSPFCNDGTCCGTVCKYLPHCCKDQWSPDCVGAAEQVCRVQACCLPNGTCEELTAFDCERADGVPQPPGSTCNTVECAPRTEACCLPNGGCTETTPDRCHAAGGTRLGPGSNCKGDNNGNGRDDACEPNQPCDECGPGPHWVDQCPGGTDNMPSGALVGIDTTGDCIADASMVLGGPATVARTGARDDSGQFPGLSVVDGHMDVIDTEMLAMTLTGGGVTLLAGGGRGTGVMLTPTRGAIVEDGGDPSLADSFFDVFFEIEAGGQFLYNQTPLTVKSEVNCLPPLTTYIHPTGCIPLYTSPTPGQGIQIANLVAARHGTFPSCGSEVTGDCFTPHDTPFCNDGACCDKVCAFAPSCCENGWSPNCVALAERACRPQACCLPDGGCAVLSELDCLRADGAPQGAGSSCNLIECAPRIEACCLSNGGCTETTPDRCAAAGGTRLGPGSNCRGDGNGNGRDDACEPNQPCDECGPGPHWVDQCPGGSDNLPSGALVGIDVNLDCVADSSMVLSGPATVVRSNAHDVSLVFPFLGMPDGHRDVIDTQMASMTLTGGGITLLAGGGRGNGGVLRPSHGAILEQPGDPSLADSFFDIFFEVEAGGQFMYNQTPLKVESKVDCLPPVTTYIHPTGCTPLYSAPVGGAHVANLVSARHGTFPSCGSEVTGDCFTPHDSPFCNDGACCEKVCAFAPFCCENAWSPNCAGLAERVCRPQACCLRNGQCVEVPELDCVLSHGRPQGSGTDCDTVTCPRPGDMDGDGDVDLDDWTAFRRCFGGPNRPLPTGCDGADLDGDGDVDSMDASLFFGYFTGSQN